MIYFNPFIGQDYKRHRVMLLGEAHVCGECTCSECLVNKDTKCINGHIDLVNKQIAMGSLRTYRNIEKEFLGSAIDNEKDRSEFWNQFLFTNLLSIAMHQSSMAPEEKYYTDDCRERFLSLVRTFEPKYLIVFGARPFSHLPGDEHDMWKKERIQIEQDLFDVWTLCHEGHELRALQLYHPSWKRMSNEHYEIVRKRISYLLGQSN